MGLGAALGAGVDAYNERVDTKDKMALAEREVSDRERYTDQQISSSKTNQKLTNMQINEIQAQQRRKAEYWKMITNDTNNTIGNPDSNAGQTTQSEVDKKQIQELTTKVVDMESRDVTDKVGSNFLTEVAETGQFFQYDQVNKWIQSDPLMKSMVQGTLVQYNDNDMNHKKALLSMASSSKQDTETMHGALTLMAKDGLIGIDTSTNKPWDIMGMFNATGISNRVPKSLVKKATTASATRLESNMPKPEPVATSDGLKMPTMTTYKGRNPQSIINMAKAVGEEPPQEAVDADNANKESMQNYIATRETMEFEDLEGKIQSGTATEADTARYKVLAKGNLKGSDLSGAYKMADLAEDRAKVKPFFEDNSMPTNADREWMVNTESQNVVKADAMYKDARTKVRGAVASGKRVNGILTDLKTFADSGEILTGLLADETKTALAKDPAALEKAAEMVATADTEEAKVAARAKVDRMLRNTIKIDTPLGLELANFIKEMSGAAVSDQERAFLVDIVQSIQRGNPIAVGTALESFRDSRLNSNEQYITDKSMQSVIPDTLYSAKEAGPALRIHYDIGRVNSVTENVVDDPNSGWWDKTKNFFSGGNDEKPRENAFLKGYN